MAKTNMSSQPIGNGIFPISGSNKSSLIPVDVEPAGNDRHGGEYQLQNGSDIRKEIKPNGHPSIPLGDKHTSFASEDCDADNLPAEKSIPVVAHTRTGSGSSLSSHSGEITFNDGGIKNGSSDPTPADFSDSDPLVTPRDSSISRGARPPVASFSSSSSPLVTTQTPEVGDSPPSSAAPIDSALLSALCDPRERWNVLKLEQVLVDLMKQRHVGFVELNPNGGAIFSSNGNHVGPQQQTGGTQQVPAASCGYPDQQPKHCTSFHRLCLHRLADRFGIVRESPSDGNSHGQGVNLIRLVKTKSSHTPAQLLIDLDVSGHGAKDDGNGANKVTKSMSATNLEASGGGSKSQKQPNSGKKMMIMKRNGNDPFSKKSDSKSDGKKKKQGLKGKKMDEKERAYAEVRARIFGESTGGAVSEVPATSTTRTERYSPGLPNIPPPFEPQPQVEPEVVAVKRGSGKVRASNGGADGGGGTKATWRNRMQEENDPDFRRGRVAVPVQYGHAYTNTYNEAYAVPSTSAYNPGTQQYQHHQQTMYYSGQQYVVGRQDYAYSQQAHSNYHQTSTYYGGEQHEQSASNEESSDLNRIGVDASGKSVYHNEFPELGR
mmetsp:Transcript_3273/g.6797  ORF Transcript_3273/g.6797 Transcript_3273/m.6797 type:complete len:603 (+) Transcript_3273:359-2167(+)